MERLAAGKANYQAKRFTDATDEFRIACFGFLDKPILLSEGLVRLALAESAANVSVELRSTLNRFLDVERRIPSYSRANLEPEIQSQFQEVLTRLVPESAIRSVPTLSSLVETPEQQVLKLPPKEKESELKAKAEKEPKEPRWPMHLARLAAANSDDREVVKWATRVLEISPADPDAQALRGHALVARSEYAKALADLSALPAERLDREPDLLADLFVCDAALKDWESTRVLESRLQAPALDRKDVKQAKEQLAKQAEKAQKEAEREAARRPAAEPSPPAATPTAPPVPAAAPPVTETARSNPVDAAIQETRQLVGAGKPGEAEEKLLPLAAANPKRRDLHLALLEVACLARDWKTGVAQVAALGAFQDGEEPSMFYAAVVLYESGDLGRAKAYLQKALPRIASTPYTQFYAKKILGP
jgi:hypothetical protein